MDLRHGGIYVRLLLVEDRKELCDLLAKLFKTHNIDIDISHDGAEGLELALSSDYSVIILDIMLPSMNGIEILRNLRQNAIKTPVIMLTARETVKDKVFALELGADDYVVKPFEFEELYARVRALTRRGPILFQEVITVGNTSINLKNYEVRMCGQLIKTSLKEAKIIEKLFSQTGNFISKDNILLILSGRNGDISSNIVEVYIHHLRKKFPPELSGFSIENKSNFGYRLTRKG